MLVRVMYSDNSYDIVQVSQLDDLIISGRVVKFLRTEGWVTVGLDPIRTFSRTFAGQNRRTDLEHQDIPLPTYAITSPAKQTRPDIP